MRIRWSMLCSLFAILFTLLTLSCSRSPESVPGAWIDYPREGETFFSGTSVTVLSHAFAQDGVAEVVLSINGEAYRRDVPVEIGRDFIALEQVWVPGEAGIYTLQIQAYDRTGQPGNPAVISVEVVSDAPTIVPMLNATTTPVATVTSVVTATLVITVAPVITVTPVEVTTVPPPPADTMPPPVPVPVVPTQGLELPCRATQTLAWLPVDDPSGISGYYVKLEMEVTTGQWQSVGGYGPITDKLVDVNVQCGVHYRWSVRARDGAENYSNWSAPSSFSVGLN